MMFIIMLMSCVTLTSCGDDDDEPSLNNVIGTWYGTRSYYNPVGGTKYQYLTLEFESNGTGSLEYESPVSYSIAKFKYSIKGNTIHCSGAYANTYGDVEDDFSMSLLIDGDRLIPQDKYTQFILTRDNSIMTDGDGNEIIDQSNQLQNVWVSTSGETVTVFYDYEYEEYVLSSNFAKTYTVKYDGTYSYNPARKIVNINGTQFNIVSLTDSFLSLKSESSGKIFNYNKGTQSDIPRKAN